MKVFYTKDAVLHLTEAVPKEQALQNLHLAILECLRAGVVPTVNTSASEPLAMRNYELHIDAREVRQ